MVAPTLPVLSLSQASHEFVPYTLGPPGNTCSISMELLNYQWRTDPYSLPGNGVRLSLLLSQTSVHVVVKVWIAELLNN